MVKWHGGLGLGFYLNVAQVLTEHPEKQQMKTLTCAFPSAAVMWILGDGSIEKQLVALILQSDVINPLKTVQHNDVISGTNVENMMEIWYFCLFNVLIWGKLQSSHHTQMSCEAEALVDV